ncbi:ribonuclease P/MRP protein subunit POP5 isoform 2-T2 [Discoglossus pictus]
MRFKSRYFLCELVLEDPRWRHNISHGMIVHNVREAVSRIHGDFGAAACSSSLSVKYLNAYTGIILIRCRKAFHQLLWSSLPFITSLDNRGQRCSCFINTLHVGEERDTIKKSIASCSLHNVEESEYVLGEEDQEMDM